MRQPTGSMQQTQWGSLLPVLHREWKQGEHVQVIGPTGVGKTTLISRLLPVRSYVVVFVTKVHDKTIERDFKGYTRIEEWPPKVYQQRVLLWPKPAHVRNKLGVNSASIRATIGKQRDVFQQAMDAIFEDKGWCCVFDEQHYICNTLKLEPENTMFQHQGRSSNLSCINGAQRPSHVPVVTYSGSTHAFLWKNTIGHDLKRLSDIGGIDNRVLVENMQQLDKHEFIYVNTRTGFTTRSQVER